METEGNKNIIQEAKVNDSETLLKSLQSISEISNLEKFSSDLFSLFNLKHQEAYLNIFIQIISKGISLKLDFNQAFKKFSKEVHEITNAFSEIYDKKFINIFLTSIILNNELSLDNWVWLHQLLNYRMFQLKNQSRIIYLPIIEKLQKLSSSNILIKKEIAFSLISNVLFETNVESYPIEGVLENFVNEIEEYSHDSGIVYLAILFRGIFICSEICLYFKNDKSKNSKMFKTFFNFYNQISKSSFQESLLVEKFYLFPEFKLKLDNKFSITDIIFNELFLAMRSLVKKNAAELFSYIEELLPSNIFKQNIENEPAKLYSLWNSDVSNFSLISIFLNTKIEELKINIISLINGFLECSPIKLWIGDIDNPSLTQKNKNNPKGNMKGKSVPFVTMSEKIKIIIKNLFYETSFLIEHSDNENVKAKLLELISVLIKINQNNEYNLNLLNFIFEKIIDQFIFSSDFSLTKIHSLNCLKMAYIKFGEKMPPKYLKEGTHDIVSFFICKTYKQKAEIYIAFLDLLSKCVKVSSVTIAKHLLELVKLSDELLKEEDELINFSILGFFDSCLRASSIIFTPIKEQTESQKLLSEFILKDEVIRFIAFISYQMSYSTNSSIVEILFKMLAAIDQVKFKKLGKSFFEFAKIMSLSTEKASNRRVKLETIRLIGQLIIQEDAYKNDAYLNEVIDNVLYINASKEDPLAFRASLALSNIASIMENVKSTKLGKLLNTSITYAKSKKEKLACYGIRAIGHLLKIPDIKIEKGLLNEAFELIESKLKSNHLKLLWNSCSALANILKNSCLKDINDICPALFERACNLMRNHINFKVKTHASEAIINSTRIQLGKKIPQIFNDLIDILDDIFLSKKSDLASEQNVRWENQLMYLFTTFILKLESKLDEKIFSDILTSKAENIIRNFETYIKRKNAYIEYLQSLKVEDLEYLQKASENVELIIKSSKQMHGLINGCESIRVSFQITEQFLNFSNGKFKNNQLG